MSPPRFIPPGTIRVALAPIPVETASELEARALPLMNAEERTRYEQLTAPIKRREFLVTRALVRTELSRHATVAPRDWVFRSNEQGRPEIASEGPEKTLRFNLSNTRGLVACVVADGIEVGVDVEDTSLRRETVGIANRFFSATEVSDLKALPEALQRDRFFDYWTLKESYIKARGLGLAIPLDGFSFRFDPLRLELEARVGNDALAWQFWLQSPQPEHRLAVAARPPSARPLTLAVEWVSAFG